MTYCVGYHFGGSVFLLADTVVEMGCPGETNSFTSYGQRFENHHTASLRETAVKLHSIAANCILAIAGDASRALSAVSALQLAYSENISIPILCDQLWFSIDTSNCSHFEFLIARSRDSGPELWYWSSRARQAQLANHDDLLTIGEIHDGIDFEVWRAARTLRATEISTYEMLLLMTAAFQAAFLRNLTVATGAPMGGMVLSVMIDTTGPTWTPDVNYLLYSSHSNPLELIQFRYRDGGFGITSPYFDLPRLCVTGKSADSWRNTWAQPIIESMFHQRAAVWVFMSTIGDGMVIIHDSVPFNKCGLFDASFQTRRTVGFGINEHLYELLPVVASISEPPQILHAHSSRATEMVQGILSLLNDPVRRNALLESQRNFIESISPSDDPSHSLGNEAS